MDRRTFLKSIAAGAAGTALCGTHIFADDKEAKMPNIIFIMADDLGYSDLGCYGQQKIQTPCIDKMADEGNASPSVTQAVPSALRPEAC